MIIPAIDLINGQVVRLYQGDYGQKTAYSDNPQARFDDYVSQGAAQLHLVDLDGARPGAVAGSPLLARGLDIPDGVAHSPDGRWIAVSNHNEHCVRLYDTSRPLGPDAEPDARLLGVDYPHGLRFVENSRRILVADAGAPFVHVYTCPDGRWRGEQRHGCRLRVLDEDTFLQGRSNPQEGGPKGLDLDRSGRLMVITNEMVPLAFFDLRSLPGPSLEDGRADPCPAEVRPMQDAQVWRRQVQGLARTRVLTAGDSALSFYQA